MLQYITYKKNKWMLQISVFAGLGHEHVAAAQAEKRLSLNQGSFVISHLKEFQRDSRRFLLGKILPRSAIFLRHFFMLTPEGS